MSELPQFSTCVQLYQNQQCPQGKQLQVAEAGGSSPQGFSEVSSFSCPTASEFNISQGGTWLHAQPLKPLILSLHSSPVTDRSQDCTSSLACSQSHPRTQRGKQRCPVGWPLAPRLQFLWSSLLPWLPGVLENTIVMFIQVYYRLSYPQGREGLFKGGQN